jgi:non-heme chloroperoxidase
MIHGAFCGGWAFDEFRKPFEARGHRVLAPTLRHHDRGQEPPAALAQTSILDFASDLEKQIAQLKEKPILIGHSMGGLLAQILAAKGHARACVLLAPCAPWGVLPSTIFEVASAQAMFFAGDFWAKLIRPSYEIAAAHALDKMPKDKRREVFSHFVPESGRATFEIMQWAMDPGRAATVDARRVRCPVLCLAGSEDRINAPSTVRRVAQRYREFATFEELEGSSHWLIGEPGWEDVAARAMDWLDEVLLDDKAIAAR